jgi:periplasmic divalent cation tolerance protein
MSEFGDVIQVVTAIGTKADAQKIAGEVVSTRLAACAQVIGPVTSTYWWQGKMETEEEWLCVMKSRSDVYEALEMRIRAAHPYEVAEILAVPVVAGSKEYLAWMAEELGRGKTAQSGGTSLRSGS